MLEALARANDVPDESLLELYRLAVSAGAEPTRGSVGCFIAQQREQVSVLFPDGLSILSREIGKQKNGEKFPVVGAQAPFWGIESVDVRVLQDQDAALVVTGSDGRNPYQLAYVLSDAAEIESFAQDLQAARTADAQTRAARLDARVTSSLPREEQHAALRQMREMTGMPDDAYAALVREVEEGRTRPE